MTGIPSRAGRLAIVGALVCGWAASAIADELSTVAAGALCVTNGAVSSLPTGRLVIDTASSRGFARGSDGQAAEIRFRYLGPSASSKPLASGEMRRQIGIKLHA